jgi:hypothetical protein
VGNETLPGNQLAGIDQCNCFTVRRAARQISRFYDAHLQPTGLRITQFLTLAILSEEIRFDSCATTHR